MERDNLSSSLQDYVLGEVVLTDLLQLDHILLRPEKREFRTLRL